MSSLIPMAMYGLEVPAGDVAISAKPEVPSAFRITMAAIDPTAEPEGDEGDKPRATLKVIRQSLLDFDDDDDDEEFDVDEMERMLAGEDGDDSDDEMVNGGPSDPSKTKQARKAAAQREIEAMLADEGMDDDEDEDDEDDDSDTPNGVNGFKKSIKALGKMPANEDDEDEEDSDEDTEVEEFVICTLDPEKNYQQPLDITIGEDERVWFKVSGTHSIFLTGNYVEPAGGPVGFESDSDEEDGYDLEPDSDELDEDEEEDELDDMEDPRITELYEEDEDEAPALIKRLEKKTETAKKGKNKRPADEDEPMTLDESIAEAKKTEAVNVNGESKLSKKQLKKLKKNDGTATATVTVEEKKGSDAPASAKSDKKVSFAKELEQGPTPSKDNEKEKPKAATLGVKVVQGVTIDDKKMGTGPAAKSGDRVGMRYIGKLQKDNKVFDSNKKGKPFTFKLGAGEVIKGWEIGVQGMSAGGERRITIPAHLAYGSKPQGPIPANSTLVFDVKLLEIKK